MKFHGSANEAEIKRVSDNGLGGWIQCFIMLHINISFLCFFDANEETKTKLPKKKKWIERERQREGELKKEEILERESNV